MTNITLKYLFAVLILLSSKLSVASPTQITADESLGHLIESYSWNVPIAIENIEGSDTSIKNDPFWPQVVELVAISRTEREKAKSKLLDDLSSTGSFENKKQIATQFVIDSQKYSDTFFEKLSELIDPLQQKDALKRGHIPTTNWMYDPLTFSLIDAEAELLEKARKLQTSRLLTAMAAWKKSNNETASPDERNKSAFSIAMLNLDNSISTLEMLSPQQRAQVMELIFTERGTMSASQSLDILSERWNAFAQDDTLRAVLDVKVKKLRKIIAELESIE